MSPRRTITNIRAPWRASFVALGQGNTLCRQQSHSATWLPQVRRHATASASEAATSTPPNPADSFLHGGAAAYIDEMYDAWKRSPDAVHVSWQVYFRNMEDRSIPSSQAFQPPPGLISSRDRHRLPLTAPGLTPGQGQGQPAGVINHAKVQELVQAYQSRGHYHAKTDPLCLLQPDTGRQPDAELDPAHYGFSPADMDRYVTLGPGILPQFATQDRKTMMLREVIAACEATYCGTYSVEYKHIPDREKRDWLRERLEVSVPIRFSADEKRGILNNLIWASSFERFLASKFPNEKRFGLDGSESLVPGVASIMDRSADEHGVDSFIVGSCHRGRITMLPTVWGKPSEAIFAEFSGRVRSDVTRGMAGDVKYHVGHDGERVSSGGRRISVSLLANPSHLEAVDPVATGRAYAAQQLKGRSRGGDCSNAEMQKKRVMCLALHGDAAISGQGVVYETLGLSRLPAYDVGGTVRVIVNNQVGFTTEVENSRATPYASDISKYVGAPVFHVNGDDVEAVVFLCRLAADWRATFHTDCVVDIVSYRKHGHNEMDQPSFTQPLMYQAIAAQKPSLEQYIDRLVSEGSFSRAEIESQQKWVWDRLTEMYNDSKKVVSERTGFPPAWEGSMESPESAAARVLPACPSTGVDDATLRSIGDKITSIPEDLKFHPHPNLKRVLDGRKQAIDGGTVDWTTAEAFALGSLCLEGNPVRFTGQDVQRGTFSQRHAVLHDQTTGRTWTPLNELGEDQAPLTISNSPLSEFAALGFEYGVTLTDPHSLVVWEAQFGDFANNAQVVIDNFIAAGESKWLDRSGVVLSLPHGYDGQGAEHSSARLERFLLLCNEEGRAWPGELERAHQDANMSVVYPTSPANYFHLLRRQMRREYRKPMVIFFSKSLLRHPLTRSDMTELTGSTSFQPVLSDPEHGSSINEPESIKRVIFCSGQVYATLHRHRQAEGFRDCAITRIEELHPFPWAQVQANMDMYPNAETIVWAQEEHYNGGAWHYIRDRLETVMRARTDGLKDLKVVYAGRDPSASTAAGLKSIHVAEEDKLMQDAFSVREE